MLPPPLPEEPEPDEPDEPDEEDDEPPLSDDFDSLLASDFVSTFVPPLLLDSEEDDEGFDEEYRSAYQPPPFRMKLPPLIWRFAVGFPHFGQASTGASVIF